MFHVVDIFAGPGGLSEGFASLTIRKGRQRLSPFRIVLSAEMDAAAHETLRLRAFVRQFKKRLPDSYYEFLANPSKRTGDMCPEALSAHKRQWDKASSEALKLRLGRPKDNSALYQAIAERVPKNQRWVLIGGPPCQAYSLVGRARNRGKKHYRASRDKRHFLYKEYLHILEKFQPDAFIMENVKGILSSEIGGERIFNKILSDLSNPAKALGKEGKGTPYTLIPLGRNWKKQQAGSAPNPDQFVLFSEKYGVPQRRHRVILLGLKTELGIDNSAALPRKKKQRTVREAWSGLPALRSGLSGQQDTPAAWAEQIKRQRDSLLKIVGTQDKALWNRINKTTPKTNAARGAISQPLRGSGMKVSKMPDELARFIVDRRMPCVVNHETRRHMKSDLRRYLYCATFAKAHRGRSPHSSEFPKQLAPNHSSWKSGDFGDRFRVHAAGKPANTITSHIAKDGHYFIHYDPSQCRAMTVREAARLQTFPDNYFFLGTRTQQFTQVGNAVPPFLANAIAAKVYELLSKI